MRAQSAIICSCLPMTVGLLRDIIGRVMMRPGPCGKTCMYGMALADLWSSLILAPWDPGRQVFQSTEVLDRRYATTIPGRQYCWRCDCLTPERHRCSRRHATTQASLYGRAGAGRHRLVSV